MFRGFAFSIFVLFRPAFNPFRPGCEKASAEESGKSVYSLNDPCQCCTPSSLPFLLTTGLTHGLHISRKNRKHKAANTFSKEAEK